MRRSRPLRQVAPAVLLLNQRADAARATTPNDAMTDTFDELGGNRWRATIFAVFFASTWSARGLGNFA